jgi:hypothetical protein
MVELKIHRKADVAELPMFRRASEIAAELLVELRRPETLSRLLDANQPGVSSALVQQTFLPVALKLGFKDEAKGLFATYENKYLRPDYFLKLSDRDGILLEVERGKTTINNMDLLDFWKCHICEHANYLFLMVPRELRQNAQMSPRREFNAVNTRIATLFLPGNYTNVDGVFLFGY